MLKGAWKGNFLIHRFQLFGNSFFLQLQQQLLLFYKKCSSKKEKEEVINIRLFIKLFSSVIIL